MRYKKLINVLEIPIRGPSIRSFVESFLKLNNYNKKTVEQKDDIKLVLQRKNSFTKLFNYLIREIGLFTLHNCCASCSTLSNNFLFQSFLIITVSILHLQIYVWSLDSLEIAPKVYSWCFSSSLLWICSCALEDFQGLDLNLLNYVIWELGWLVRVWHWI